MTTVTDEIKFTYNDWGGLLRFEQQALITYMLLVEESGLPIERRVEAWSKPMLLLRVMFDIPEEKAWPYGSNEERYIRINPCGGMPYRVRDGAAATRSLALPVSWSETGPLLIAVPRPVTSMRLASYQPQEEYRLFLAYFQIREGLDKFVDQKIHDWTSLIRDRVPIRP